MRQREAGQREYIWISMDDGKVRPAHVANNGKVFVWEDPPETGHPGEEYNCRCHAAPVELASLGSLISVLARLRPILIKSQGRIKQVVRKIRKKPKIPASIKNPESLRGKRIKDVEKLADKELLSKGWKKEPLKRGEGVRYTDGKGGSFEINKGYPKNSIGDDIHKGPYIKTTVGSDKVRVPLKGNPDLK